MLTSEASSAQTPGEFPGYRWQKTKPKVWICFWFHQKILIQRKVSIIEMEVQSFNPKSYMNYTSRYTFTDIMNNEYNYDFMTASCTRYNQMIKHKVFCDEITMTICWHNISCALSKQSTHVWLSWKVWPVLLPRWKNLITDCTGEEFIVGPWTITCTAAKQGALKWGLNCQ